MSVLKSPMVLIMLFMVGMMYLLPKLQPEEEERAPPRRKAEEVGSSS